MIKRILIIDDSPVATRALKGSLPNCRELKVFEASNGQEGLKKFEELKPDLTFLDLTMPVMDGIECLERIMIADNKALVVVVTADIQTMTMKKVVEMGAVRMVKKPPTKLVMEEVMADIQTRFGSG